MTTDPKEQTMNEDPVEGLMELLAESMEDIIELSKALGRLCDVVTKVAETGEFNKARLLAERDRAFRSIVDMYEREMARH